MVFVRRSSKQGFISFCSIAEQTTSQLFAVSFNYFRSFRLFEALALSFAEIQLISVHLDLNGSINLGDGDQLNFNGGECVLSTVYQCVSKFKSQRNQKDKFTTNSSSIRIYRAEWLRLIKNDVNLRHTKKHQGSLVWSFLRNIYRSVWQG